MTDSVWAVNAVTGAPAFSGKQGRQTASALIAGATSARPLGGRTGVRPGTPSSTVTATSTTWTVQPFAGVADVASSAIAGPFQFAFDAVATGTVTAADPTNPRVDIIYVQIDDPAEGDGSTVPAATRKYFAGAAAPSPVAPALPVSRAFVVANINVPASGGGSPTVTWNAPYTAAAGAPVPFNTWAQLQAWAPTAPLQHAEVFADPTAQNNGPYTWDVTNSLWRKSGAFAVAQGVATISGAAGSSSTPLFWGGSETVTFPTGRFSVAPIVQAQILNPQGAVEWVTVLTTSSTGFTYRILRAAAAPATGTTIQWTAIQMTPTSADG